MYFKLTIDRNLIQSNIYSTLAKMVIKAEIISQPLSGEFEEQIYNLENMWNSQNWTFIKFTNQNGLEWCGHFRGTPRGVEVSTTYQTVIILTSDHLIQLDSKTAELMAFEDSPQYQNLTLAPDQSFIIADYMNVEKFTNDIIQKQLIASPIDMDYIEFKNWNENKLEFICLEFVYWEKDYHMTYDYITNLIEIKNSK